MKAAVLYQPNTPMVIEDLTIDKPASKEILIRVRGSGLCHSDLHFMTGDLPFEGPTVFGHEVAGVIEQVGPDVSSFQVGDHVVVCAAGFCGHCDACASGKSQLCTAKPVRSVSEPPRLTKAHRSIGQGINIGGFAEQVLVHENWAVKVNRDIPFDRAALLGCSVLTGLGSVFNAAKVTPGSTVVVVGCGGVGLNVVQGARIAGAARVIAVDLNPAKLELAAAFGATDRVPGGQDSDARVRELTKGGVDFAFEVIGLPTTINQAIQMLRPSGLLTLVGATRPDALAMVPTLFMLMNEWRIQGCFMGSTPFVRDIPRYADMYLSGTLELDRLVAERIHLEQVNQGYDAMKTGSQARSVIVFD